jgi:alpha-glucosidase
MAVVKPLHRPTQPIAKAAPWWQTGVIYQIYVRSFKDTNGDGIGDLNGVTLKLDYLKELGVSGIWLSPVTVSANADWGYDVMDYRDIDADLGTMADFDRLLAEAHRRDIKVLVDFVPNHTSIHHPWFQNALTGRHARYRDFYIWADGKPGHRHPNNWRSWFGGSAWKYHRPTKQYFLHNFLPEQADLNWRNPAVREEFDSIMRFWLDKGVDGFRVDVANMLIKDKHLRDNPKSSKQDDLEVWVFGQKPTYTTSRPEVHRILRRWRQLVDEYPGHRLLLGETTMTYQVKDVASYYGVQDELELAFNFNYIRSAFQAPALKKVVKQTERALKSPDWPVWTNGNHDEYSRFSTRWARGDTRKVRIGLLLLMALRGTPVLYYGDEIGLQNVYVPPWRLKDRWGKKYWPVLSGRDKGRTPMPWKLDVGAGFTEPGVRPWLPYGRLQEENVEEQSLHRESHLAFTRELMRLRADVPDLQVGDYQLLPTVSAVWAWQRGNHIKVAVNMSNHHQELTGMYGTTVLSTTGQRKGEEISDVLHLQPWEGVIVSTG